MKTDFEAYYASLRRQALRQMEARQRECSALDPAFDALQAKRSRAFSMPAQGAKLTLSTVRLEEEALLKRYGLPKDYLQPLYRCPLCQDTGYRDAGREPEPDGHPAALRGFKGHPAGDGQGRLLLRGMLGRRHL